MHRARTYRTTGNAAAGFTLVEILVVLVLMGLVTALAIPSFAGRSQSLQAREAARHLYQVLQSARSQAITTANPVSLLLDYRQQLLQLEQETAYELPRDMRIRARGAPATQTLTFYPDGSASPAAFRLEAAGRTFRYTIEPLTGRIGFDVDRRHG